MMLEYQADAGPGPGRKLILPGLSSGRKTGDAVARLENKVGSLIDAGRLNEALAFCSRAIARNKDFAEAYIHRARVLTICHRYDDAIPDCEIALSFRPRWSGVAYSEYAHALRCAGRLEDAIEASMLAIERSDARAFVELGIALYQLRRYEDAIKPLQHALGLDTDQALALKVLAFAYRDSGRVNDLLDACGRALNHDPATGWAHHLRICALREEGRHEEARAACESAIAVLPPEPLLYHALLNAIISMDGGNESDDTLLNLCTRAIAACPNESFFYALRGSCLLQLGRLAEASDACDRAFALDPEEAFVIETCDALEGMRQGIPPAIIIKENKREIEDDLNTGYDVDIMDTTNLFGQSQPAADPKREARTSPTTEKYSDAAHEAAQPPEAKLLLGELPPSLRGRGYTKRNAPIDPELAKAAGRVASNHQRRRGKVEFTEEERAAVRAAWRVRQAKRRERGKLTPS